MISKNGAISLMWLLICCGVLFAAFQEHAYAVQRALLVGVGSYKTKDLKILDGPVPDVEAFSSVLTSHWRFAPDHVTVLKDEQASRENILKSLANLVDTSQRGDFMLFYYSGHGTSVEDIEFGLPLPDGTGALVPWDFAIKGTRKKQLESIIVGRRDIRPLLEQADAKGVEFLMITDACFSGYASRSMRSYCPGVLAKHNELKRERYVGLKSSTDSFDSRDWQMPTFTITENKHPYRNGIGLAASSVKEKAKDIGRNDLDLFPTWDKRPHGAFTDSLLRILAGERQADADGDGVLTYQELYDELTEHMRIRGYNHRPFMLPKRSEDIAGLTQQPIFGQSIVKPPGSTPYEGAEDQQKLRLTTVRYETRADGVPREIVNDPQETRVFESLKDVVVVRREPHLAAVRAGDEWSFWTLGCERITTVDDDRSAQTVVNHYVSARSLEMQGDRQQISVDLEIVGRMNETLSVDREFYEDGEVVSFSVHLQRPAYLLVLNWDSQGGYTVLYPYEQYEVTKLQPGESSFFKTRVREPFGIDHVLAVVFDEAPPWYSRLVTKAKSERLARIAPGTAEHQQFKTWIESDAIDGKDLERLVIRDRR